MELGLFRDSVVEFEGGGLHGRRPFGRSDRGKDVKLAVLVFDWLRVVGQKRRPSECRCVEHDDQDQQA